MSVPASLSGFTPATRKIAAETVLWRIHSTAGLFPTAWDELRHYGPLPGARWDHHPEPAGEYPQLGIAYLGFDPLTCLAEVFQDERSINTRDGQYLTGIRLHRKLTLLDLSTDWFLRIGGTSGSVIGSGHDAKETSRSWARLLYSTWPAFDGMVAPSAIVPGREIVAIWKGSAFPESPSLSERLDSPIILNDISNLAETIGYAAEF